MNNLTNTILTRVVNFAETPGVIANAADMLLGYILSKDDAAALCWTYKCDGCGKEKPGQRRCRRCCDGYPCYDVFKPCTP